MVEVKISYKLLLQIKQYIEDVEVQIEGEWGSCRELDELLRDDAMPIIYYKLCETIDNIKNNRNK